MSWFSIVKRSLVDEVRDYWKGQGILHVIYNRSKYGPADPPYSNVKRFYVNKADPDIYELAMHFKNESNDAEFIYAIDKHGENVLSGDDFNIKGSYFGMGLTEFKIRKR